MPFNIRKWFHQRETMAGQSEVPPLTFLPNPPPRLAMEISNSEGTSNSLIFRKLPVELRYHILVQAFGNMTLHANLLILRPPRRSKYSKRRKPSKHSETLQLYDNDDASQPYSWKRIGGVCHGSCSRHEPRRVWFDFGDWCTSGSYDCDSKPPIECIIGALGWMLSCRQAYTEGIEVLYGSNSFRLNEVFVLENITGLLPKISLELISVLSFRWVFNNHEDFASRQVQAGARNDVSWHIRPRPVQYPRAPAQVHEVSNYLALLAKTFPNLRSLHISNSGVLWKDLQLEAQLMHSADLYNQVERLLIAYVEAIQNLGRLRRFQVGFDSSVYFPWIQEVLNIHEFPYRWTMKELYPTAIWRETSSLDGCSSNQLDRYLVSLDAWDCEPKISII